MTAYTAIPDTDIDPDSPLTTTLLTLIRDNPIAISEGTSPAPKIQTLALRDSVAGSTNKVFAMTGGGATGGTYIKLSDVRVPTGGALNVVFDLRSNTATLIVYARIYVNGIAVGTERSTTLSTNTTFSENITGLNSGDNVQIYTKGTGIAVVSNSWIRENDPYQYSTVL